MTQLDGAYGWLIVACCFYGQFAVIGAFLSLGAYYPLWVDDFSSSRGITSWVVALSLGTCNGFGPVIASLVFRFGHRPVMMAGALLSALGIFLSAFATSVYMLIILIGIVGGFGLGMLYLPTNSVLPLYFKKRRSLALGIVLCGTGLGNFVYPPLITWLVDQMHWRGSLIVISGCMLQMVVLGALIRPRGPGKSQVKDKENNESSRDTKSKVEDSSSVHSNECSSHDRPSLLNDYATGVKGLEPQTAISERTLNRLTSQSSISQSEDNLHEVPSLYTKETLKHMSFTVCKKNKANQLAESPVGASGDVTSVNCTYNGSDSSVMALQSQNSSVGYSQENVPNEFHNLQVEQNSKTRAEQPEQVYSASSAMDNFRISDSFSGTYSRNRIIASSQNPSTQCIPASHTEISATPSPPCSTSWFAHLKSTMQLLKNPYFATFAVSNFLTALTIIMPPVYMTDRAIENGVGKAGAALALSMHGAGHLFGRLGLGVIADRGVLDCLTLNSICLIICGVSTCLSPLCGANAILHGLYGFVFGTFIGGMITLSPLILVDLLGVKMFNSSLGLCFMFRAIGMVLGTPVAGWIYDASGSYTASFIIHGVIIGISGLVLAVLKLALARSKRLDVAAAIAAAAVAVTGVTNEAFVAESSA